ncbi:MAG: hypothetical protein NTZ39_02890 [Methanoregula sp.]|nr:hypothetical protein [Methanoregula sp.]
MLDISPAVAREEEEWDITGLDSYQLLRNPMPSMSGIWWSDTITS